MGEIKLKSRPFCGGQADFVNYGTDGVFDDWDIECKQCQILFVCPGAEDGAVTTKEEASVAWNMRVGEEK